MDNCDLYLLRKVDDMTVSTVMVAMVLPKYSHPHSTAISTKSRTFELVSPHVPSTMGFKFKGLKKISNGPLVVIRIERGQSLKHVEYDVMLLVVNIYDSLDLF